MLLTQTWILGGSFHWFCKCYSHLTQRGFFSFDTTWILGRNCLSRQQGDMSAMSWMPSLENIVSLSSTTSSTMSSNSSSLPLMYRRLWQKWRTTYKYSKTLPKRSVSEKMVVILLFVPCCLCTCITAACQMW